MRRVAIWTVALPLSGAGVLVAHGLAYAAVGASGDDVHGYLAHAPQFAAVIATVSLCLLALQGRSQAPAPWQFATLAVAAFVVQEHAERLLHSGELPWLLDRPEFLLGLLLQLPVAALVWWLARRLLALVGPSRRRPPLLPRLLLPVADVTAASVAIARPARPVGRAPPFLPW
jgi:hypothetical protein